MKTNHKGGYVLVMAMLLLVLGLTFSGWLFAVISNNVAITRNESQGVRAAAAADTGLEYLRHQLGIVTSQTTFRGLQTETQILTRIADVMAARGESGAIGASVTGDGVLGFTFSPLTLASGDSFVCEVTPSQKYAAGYTLLATGRSGPTNEQITRTICMEVNAKIAFGSSSMDYPIVARKEIGIDGNSAILRYDPDTGITDDRGIVGTAVGEFGEQLSYLYFEGYSPRPEGELLLPDKYLTNSFYSALNAMKGSVLQSQSTNVTSGKVTNIYLPSSSTTTSAPRRFENCIVEGIVYVEWPNSIELSGNVTLNAVIIYGKPPDGTDLTKTNLNNIVTVDRQSLVESSPDAAKSFLEAAFASVDPTNAASLFSEISGWAMFAPDCDLELKAGTDVTSASTLEGNFHLRNLGKAAGQGQGGFLNIYGQILCEGEVDLTGNRILYMEPPTEGDNIQFERRAKLTMSAGAYWEKH